MKHVAPLRYDVIFKKAFCDPEIFSGFVRDVVGIQIEISKVETEKSFRPAVGRVASRFDLFAEDLKNRIIVDIQHVRHPDHYDAFLHYHCVAILEQVAQSENYRPKLAVYSIIVLTSGDKHQVGRVTIDFDPKTDENVGLGEIPHKIIYLCPKYANEKMPPALREWMQAINDTLDEAVEENEYQNPLIQRIFNLIEQDSVSPEERAKMFEEFNLEQVKRETYNEGKAEGKAEGKQEEKIEIARSLVAKGIAVALISEVTGLNETEIAQLSAT